MSENIQTQPPERESIDVSERDDLVSASHTANTDEWPRSTGRPVDMPSTRDVGAPAMIPESFSETSFSHYSNRELEGLIHVLIYRIDLLLAGLKLSNWGNQDFSRTIEETEAILNEGAMYEIGRTMDRMIRALESVAAAAETTARYSMLSAGYSESTEQLEEALNILHEIQRDSPVAPQAQPDLE